MIVSDSNSPPPPPLAVPELESECGLAELAAA